MKKDLNSIILTRREFDIMNVIWEYGVATVGQVRKAMPHNSAYTTIGTMMTILETKGALIHGQKGRSFVYMPFLSRRQAVRNQIRDLLSQYFDGTNENLIEFILINEITSASQLTNARRLLESMKV